MASKRKLIGFDPETLQALEQLARDSGSSVQYLADEAFADLLAKHHRPRTLKEALKQSARSEPANENKPRKESLLLACRLG
jgi:predicted transcriptional regulator